MRVTGMVSYGPGHTAGCVSVCLMIVLVRLVAAVAGSGERMKNEE